MGLRVAFQCHHPKEEEETDDGEEARPHEEVVRFAFFPAEIDCKTETYGVEDQQLVRNVLQGVVQPETTAASQQMVLEAGKIVPDLPEDMRQEQHSGKQDGDFGSFSSLRLESRTNPTTSTAIYLL